MLQAKLAGVMAGTLIYLGASRLLQGNADALSMPLVVCGFAVGVPFSSISPPFSRSGRVPPFGHLQMSSLSHCPPPCRKVGRVKKTRSPMKVQIAYRKR